MKLYKWVHRLGTTGVDQWGAPAPNIKFVHCKPMQWGPGKSNAIGTGWRRPVLCTNGVIHAYTSVLHAMMFRDHHFSKGYPGDLWEAEGEVVIDDGSKVGCYELTTIRTIKEPQVDDAIDPAARAAAKIMRRMGRLPQNQHMKIWPEWLETIYSSVEYMLDEYLAKGKVTPPMRLSMLEHLSIPDLYFMKMIVNPDSCSRTRFFYSSIDVIDNYVQWGGGPSFIGDTINEESKSLEANLEYHPQ